MVKYVIDTNVVIANPLFTNEFNNCEIIIPIYVLEELDKLKNRDDNVGFRIRKFFRILKKNEDLNNLYFGINIENNIILKSSTLKIENRIPEYFDLNYNDNKILNLMLQDEYKNHILITNDISMRVKAASLNIKTEMIKASEKHKFSELYDGVCEVNVPAETVKEFYKNNEINISELNIDKMYPNQFVIATNEVSYNKLIGVYSAKKDKIVKLHYENSAPYGIAAKDIRQKFAMEILLNPEIPFVTITSKQGCGKTLLALAAALEMVVEQNIYSKIVLGKNTAPIDKWNYQGFTTGDTEEKLITHFNNYISTLENIQDIRGKSVKNGIDMLEALKNRNKLEILDISSILGTSFINKFIIIDEAQSFDIHAMRSIITRIGKNCKLVLIGDIGQQTLSRLDSDKSGFYAAIEWLKEIEESAHITLKKVHRGSFVEKASEIFDDNIFS